MIPILDWIFEGIVGWIAGITSQLLDAVSGLFLEALGTDMTAMEEYFPFVTKAYDIMQYTAWAVLMLIVLWQLFRSFGGPLTEAEDPWQLIARGAIFGLLIGYAKPIFHIILRIATAPYTSLMEISMTGEDFTFAGVEQALSNGLTTIIATASVVGLILLLILELCLGWNYFKLLLETVERYVVVGVLCYTSPLAFSLGGSKTTGTVFKSWCRMVGSQLLLLVMNVWFLRGFASSMGQFIAGGGALSTGKGSIFLWMFCALAYLKCAQRFDSYLASIGLNVAQTGSSMGMEMLLAARVLTGFGSGSRNAGSVFGHGTNAASNAGAAATGFAAGFASKFSPNSYVRDAVVNGGSRMGMSGGAGFVARAFGGIAARNGATLNSNSIASVAGRTPSTSGTIAGDIADRSLGNFMPHMQGFQLQGTEITGGHISTTAIGADGKTSQVEMFSAAQYEKPEGPHSIVTASDGSKWFQIASGEGRGAFYDAPVFNGTQTAPNAGSHSNEATGGQPMSDGSMDSGPYSGSHSNVDSGTHSGSYSSTPEETNPDFFNGSGEEPITRTEFYGGQPMPDGTMGAAAYTGTQPELDPEAAPVTNIGGYSGTAEEPYPGSISNLGEEPITGAVLSGEQTIPEPGVDTGAYIGTQPAFDPEAAPVTNLGGYSGAAEEPHSGSFTEPGGDPFADTGFSGPQPDGHTTGESTDGSSYGYDPGNSYSAESAMIAATFPGSPEGVSLRTVGDGTIEASMPDGSNSLWYNSAYFEEPDAPHSVIQSANGVDWYAMQPNAQMPQFESGEEASLYNQTEFQNFMPGYSEKAASIQHDHMDEGYFKIRNEDGSGMAFYDASRFDTPRGEYQTFEDSRGGRWYGIHGEAAVERKPLYEHGKPVYDGDKLCTVNVDTVRYRQTPAKFSQPKQRTEIPNKAPKRKMK